MTHEDRPDGPGPGLVIAGAFVGVVVSLAAGLFVAASLNTLLAVVWVRGIVALALGTVVGTALLRGVTQTARGRFRAISGGSGPGH